jgi:hypothetical protein
MNIILSCGRLRVLINEMNSFHPWIRSTGSQYRNPSWQNYIKDVPSARNDFPPVLNQPGQPAAVLNAKWISTDPFVGSMNFASSVPINHIAKSCMMIRQWLKSWIWVIVPFFDIDHFGVG